MESFLNYKIVEFLIEPHDGSSSINVTGSVSAVQYYEDLFSPAIFISVLLVNTTGLLTGLPNTDRSKQAGLKGGERVRLVIEQSATGERIVLDETKNPYYIYKVYNATTQSTREALMIELCPAEVLTNETSRVIRRYADKNISTTATRILSEVLKTNRYKKENIEDTSNSYTFMGNNKKPFTVLTWLCPKSIPTIAKSNPEAGTAGFLFYENKNGYNFRSIDSLMSAFTSHTKASTNITKYRYSETIKDSADIVGNFKILSMPVFERSVNIVENLRIGMYASDNYFLDINSRQFKLHRYKLSDSYEMMKHSSSSNKKPDVPLNLEDNSSRIMVKILDSQVQDSIGGQINSSPDKSILYQSQAVARYNLAFSQRLNITVPLNLKLTVGDIINLEIGKITKEEKQKDELKSGYYLIKELAHSFEKNQGYTALKLIRDSYGPQPNE